MPVINYYRMWLLVALLGNACLATVGVVDKLILTKAVPKPIVFVFYSTIFVLPLVLLLPFGLVQLPKNFADSIIFLISGLSFAFGVWAMYNAIAKGEVSRLGPLIGAAIPFFILCFGSFFLSEKLSLYAYIAAGFLIIGSLFVSFNEKTGSGAWHSGLDWALLAAVLFAISHMTAKYAFNTYGFVSGFVLTKIPIGFFGLALLGSTTVRQAIFKKTDADRMVAQGPLARYQAVLVGGNIALGAIGAILIQYAMSLGSVSLVNALAGVQYVLLLVIVAGISRWRPQILHETFTKQEIMHKAAAVVCIAIGLLFLLQ